MRKLAVVGIAGLLSGCMLGPYMTDQTPPTPGEMDKIASGGCQMWPDTNEWLKCRRRTSSSREPAPGEPETAYPRGYE